MSRPRSRSPNFRRFPPQDSNCHPQKLFPGLNENLPNRNHRLRHDPEDHWDLLREDVPSGGQSRSSPFVDDRQYQRRPEREELHHRGGRPSPSHSDAMDYDKRRFSPPHNMGGDGERRREGSFDHRLPALMPLMRERPAPRFHAEQQQQQQQREAGMSWRQEPVRGPGRFRDLSPGPRVEEERRGAGRERDGRSSQGPIRDRRREEPHLERSPPLKRQRKEMEGDRHSGFRHEETEFGERRYSVDPPRGGFEGGGQGSFHHADHARPVRPVIFEHGHGIAGGGGRKKFEERRDLDFEQARSPRPLRSSQERFRAPGGRAEDQEHLRERDHQEDWRDFDQVESRRSPVPQNRTNADRFGPVNQRGRGHPPRGGGRFNPGPFGRNGSPGHRPQFRKSPEGFQSPPRGEERPGYRPFRENGYQDPGQGGSQWAGGNRQDWERSRSPDQHPQRDHMDPRAPRGWMEKKRVNTTVVKEETLTIKVDMSRPASTSSSLCYSSDRQLSLDLVNVGRHRLDFLPMLEHSGTYRETDVHTGTFAQEIITLVHHVKEHYFRGDGVSLNQRFSAPQKGSYAEEEEEEEEEVGEMTLDQRFSANRGFSVNMDLLLDDDEPLFSSLESMPPERGPGDLRHDLERRRQEKLEGVTVTIPGHSRKPRPLIPLSELKFGDESWSDEAMNRRRDGNMMQRRGAPFRPHAGFQRRNNNNRFSHRDEPMRRQDNQGDLSGPNW